MTYNVCTNEMHSDHGDGNKACEQADTMDPTYCWNSTDNWESDTCTVQLYSSDNCEDDLIVDTIDSLSRKSTGFSLEGVFVMRQLC